MHIGASGSDKLAHSAHLSAPVLGDPPEPLRQFVARDLQAVDAHHSLLK